LRRHGRRLRSEMQARSASSEACPGGWYGSSNALLRCVLAHDLEMVNKGRANVEALKSCHRHSSLAGTGSGLYGNPTGRGSAVRPPATCCLSKRLVVAAARRTLLPADLRTPLPCLKLPAFDRLAAVSTVFTRTVPAGYYTDIVLPSLMTGQHVDSVAAPAAGFRCCSETPPPGHGSHSALTRRSSRTP
jgi:hypothetical protein